VKKGVSDFEKIREKAMKVAKYLKYFYIFVLGVVLLKIAKMVFIGISIH